MAAKIREWLDYIRLAFMLLVTTLRWLKTRSGGTDELRTRYALDQAEYEAGRHVRRIERELGRNEAHNYVRDMHGEKYRRWLAQQTDEQAALAKDPAELARRLARATARETHTT